MIDYLKDLHEINSKAGNNEKYFILDEQMCKKVVKNVDGTQQVFLVSDWRKKLLSGGNNEDNASALIEQKEIKMEFPQLEELTVSEQVSDVVEDKKPTAVKMAFIGGGQGGCKIADEFYEGGYERVLLVNTTSQDMAGLKCKNQVIIGKGLSGAGKNPEIGKKAADEHKEDILRACRKAFGTQVDQIIVCVGAGGGTGTGSCITLVDVARDYMVSLGKDPRVGVVASFPKKSEGAGVLSNAQGLMGKLLDGVEAKKISPLIICDNDKILKMFPKVAIAQFFKTANKNIVGLFNVFNELSCQSSPYSTLDVADYKSILGSGALVFGMTLIKDSTSETAIAEAIEKNVKGGLLSDSMSLSGATHAGAILVASKAKMETITQSSFDMAFETLSRVIGSKNLVLHSGIYEGPDSLGENIMVYSMVGGLK